MKSAVAIATATLLCIGEVASHGNLVKLTGRNGEATKVPRSDGFLMRTGVPRNGNAVPGDVPDFSCDHCIMENRPTNPNTVPSKWWTTRPASHWDNPDVWPETTPCMSNDAFGVRGVLMMVPGEEVETTWYVNADHGGFYRFEFAPGREPTNADFMENPISPFYSLHETVETPGFIYPGRVVGYNKNETDLYIDRTTIVGNGMGDLRLNDNQDAFDSAYCANNYDDCFLTDRVVIPEVPSGEYVFRFNWFSSETPQVYTGCVDVVIE